jgi:hypothetical protein
LAGTLHHDERRMPLVQVAYVGLDAQSSRIAQPPMPKTNSCINRISTPPR